MKGEISDEGDNTVTPTYRRRPEILVAPGAYDGITARLIEQARLFRALHDGRRAPRLLSACRITALLTMTEMVGNAARITAAATTPAADRRRRYRLRHRVERRAHGAGARARRHGGHPYRRPGLAQAMRSSRRQGTGLDRGIPRQDPRGAWRRDAIRISLIIARTDARSVAGFDEAIAPCQRGAGGRRRRRFRRKSGRRWRRCRWCRSGSAARAC